MSIYVTGDIHGDPRRFSADLFPEQKEMTREDFVIIVGDFGLVWDFREESYTEKYWLSWLENKPFTTLFIDGNHENFKRLYQYPVETWNGGLTHVIRPHVRHLMRGETFTLQNHTFFAFGGARSHDIDDGVLDPVDDAKKIKEWSKDPNKMFRIDGVSWWQQEMPCQEEMDRGRYRLNELNDKVDFILSHDAPASIKALIGAGLYKNDELNIYLENIAQDVDFSAWFYGHLHNDRKDIMKFIGLYEQIIRIL